MEDRLSIGGNHPPLEEQLAFKYTDLTTRSAELLEAKERLPGELDEENAPRMTAFVKQLNGFLSAAERQRKVEKQPFLDNGKTVDAWFRSLKEGVEALKNQCSQQLSQYQRAIAMEEQRRREAEAERQRQSGRDRELNACGRSLRNANVRLVKRQGAAERERKAREADDAEKARLIQKEAEAAAQDAEAKAVEKAGVKTSAEGVAHARLKSRWVCAEYNVATLDIQPLRDFFTVRAVEDALRRYAAAGNHTLDGARFEEQFTTTVR